MLPAKASDYSLSLNEAVVSEIHRSKISLHRAKAGYHYPTVRLPHQFSCLAGLSARICQTVFKGALAFLIVLPPAETANSSFNGCDYDVECSKSSVFTRRRSGVRIASIASFFFKSDALKGPLRFIYASIINKNDERCTTISYLS